MLLSLTKLFFLVAPTVTWVFSPCPTPAQPSAISGTTTVRQRSNQQYSINSVSGATSYTWTVPNDWTILSGQGTTSINVKVGNSTGTKIVQVVGTNSCATSTARTLQVSVIKSFP